MEESSCEESEDEETEEESGKTSDSTPFGGFERNSFFPRGKGRPKGSMEKEPQQLPPPLPRRRPSSTTTSSGSMSSSQVKNPSVSPSAVAALPKFKIGGTNSRAVIYLLDLPPTTTMGFSKIPKTGAVLRVFFNFLLDDPNISANSNPSTLATKVASLEAAKQTVPILKEVWCHHFGLRLIFGQEYVGGPIDTEKVMINTDRRIADKIVSLYQEWKTIEQLSRRGDQKELLKKKAEAFKEKMDIPFSILQNKGEDILCNSGIKDWKEELQHLRNQLASTQVGSCDGYDMRQKNRDERILREQESLDKKKPVKKRREKCLKKLLKLKRKI